MPRSHDDREVEVVEPVPGDGDPDRDRDQRDRQAWVSEPTGQPRSGCSAVSTSRTAALARSTTTCRRTNPVDRRSRTTSAARPARQAGTSRTAAAAIITSATPRSVTGFAMAMRPTYDSG